MKGEMRLRTIVKRVSYKTNSKVTCKRHGKLMSIGVHLWVEDTVHPGEWRWIDGYFAVGTDYMKANTDEQILGDIMWYFGALELHEVFEWFCIDGKQAINPHPLEPLIGEYSRPLGKSLRVVINKMLIGE